MRSTLIAANWKMNHTVKEAEHFFKNFKITPKEGKELLICPSFTSLPIARFFLECSSIKLGAQNVYPKDAGAFTGEVSPLMLKDLGVSYVICGHSERRQILGESDSFIGEKISALLSHDIAPILCVGETEEEREAGKAEERIREEIQVALEGKKAKSLGNLVIAYEPIWAIGTGKAATAEDAETMCAFIRAVLKEKFGAKISQSVRILYGGSVKAENIRDFMEKKNIDGALIGGAGLDPKSLIEIFDKA